MKLTEHTGLGRTRLHHLLDLVIEINRAGKYNAWFEYAGHVESLHIRTSKRGSYEIEVNQQIYISGELYDEEKVLEMFKELEAFLK